MQCASSTANSEIRVRWIAWQNRSLTNRSGATYSSRSRPERTSSITVRYSSRLKRRIEPPGGDAAGGQGVDLVLHQGDQRRDDQRQPGQHQGRNLVAQRLAAAGRKHGRGRPPGQQMPDHLLLPRLELRKAEPLGQHVAPRLRVRAVVVTAIGLHEGPRNMGGGSRLRECVLIYTFGEKPQAFLGAAFLRGATGRSGHFSARPTPYAETQKPGSPPNCSSKSHIRTSRVP